MPTKTKRPTTIKIPAPEFELYELVTLYWNELEYKTKIVELRYSLAQDLWTYQTSASSHFHPGSVLMTRS